MNILFVCTGNTCRSSMAEAMLKNMLREKELNHIKVSSAGVAASAGDRANPHAISVMQDMGIDLKDHSATPIGAGILKEADLILTMTEGHKMAVMSWDPSVWQKIYTLKEYAGMNNKDIQDPFGQSEDAYRRCSDEIKMALEKIVDKLGF